MPSIRIGYSTDFNLNNELVGIGVTTATSTLDVAGQIVADNTAASGGVSTFREYQGFQQIQQDISNNIVIDNGSSGNFNSLSGEIRISGETTVSSGSTITGGKLETLTITDKFAVPLGDTNSRDNTPEAGTTRFNQDFGTLEFFDGINWKTVNSYSRGGAAGRVVFTINTVGESLGYVNINTLGNAQNFGNLSGDRRTAYGCASSTRGLWGSGTTPARTDIIDYITIASAGNAIDFGNLDKARSAVASAASSTRGLWAGGYQDPGGTSNRTNVIQYVEISTLGNALDFGDLLSLGVSISACASSTRALFFGGYRTSPGTGSTIGAVNIASKGDEIKFGDLTHARGRSAACSNSVRGICGGGRGFPSTTALINFIDYVTIASSGNAQYFGDLTTDGTNGRNMLGAAASQTRGLFNGGYSPGETNIIDYVTIMSAGNAQDFGDLQTARRGVSALSDSHGGLGGF